MGGQSPGACSEENSSCPLPGLSSRAKGQGRGLHPAPLAAGLCPGAPALPHCPAWILLWEVGARGSAGGTQDTAAGAASPLGSGFLLRLAPRRHSRFGST